MSGKYFLVYDTASGALRWRGQGDAGEQVLDPGMGILPVSKAAYDAYADGISALPIDEIRSALWSQAKTKRDKVIDGGAATPFGAVDSYELARSNIAGAALAALIAKGAGAAYSVDWTLLDNNVVSLDADGMMAVGLAVMGHVNAAHDRARALRAQIDAAADVAALLSIDITTGWPG